MRVVLVSVCFLPLFLIASILDLFLVLVIIGMLLIMDGDDPFTRVLQVYESVLTTNVPSARVNR